MSDLILAGGRDIDPLLFVTSEKTHNLIEDSGLALELSIRKPHELVRFTDTDKPEDAAKEFWERAPREPERSKFAGVVLIGGYEHVPSQVVFAGKSKTFMDHDPDRLFVWNDDVYGDKDGAGLPELPVSRIPLVKVDDLVNGDDLRRALRARRMSAVGRRADWRKIRASGFLFPEVIHSEVPGRGSALASPPHGTFTPDNMTADRIYIALHGDSAQPSVFMNDDLNDDVRVFLQRDIPSADGVIDGAVVFAACCWGALTANTPAEKPGLTHSLPKSFATHPKDQSIALTFIANGARAFVGFTAHHWVPDQAPYEYFGSPLHGMFWVNVNHLNMPPARALFRAKAEYSLFIKGRHMAPPADPKRTWLQDAAYDLELKTLWSATCLGLGW
ncbi:MAG: hypothetical protein ACJ789_07505 [Thermomicrobiales bacterium]